MKPTIVKVIAAVSLLSASTVALASGCCGDLQCCLQMLACCWQ